MPVTLERSDSKCPLPLKSELYRVAIVGSGTLPVFCAEQLLSFGFEIKHIFCQDRLFREWAASKNFACSNTFEEFSWAIKEDPPDIIFSISNTALLPDDLCSLAKYGAYNYHDGPLPRYAGFNATSWAILNSEKTYGVTWHRISTLADAGNVILQMPVEIAPQDTALSLNLKCYKAACDGFAQLLQMIVDDRISEEPQNLGFRTFFYKRERPRDAGLLLLNNPAQRIGAVVNALHVGELYENKLCSAKLLLEGLAVQVGSCKILEVKSAAMPGTILAISDIGWTISTSSEDIILSAFRTLGGANLDPTHLAGSLGIKKGYRLPIPTDLQVAQVADTLRTSASYEPFWLGQLFSISKIDRHCTPLTSEGSSWSIGPWQTSESHSSGKARRRILTAWLLYLHRIERTENIQFGWYIGDILEEYCTDIFSTILPVLTPFKDIQTFSELNSLVNTSVDAILKRPILSRDLRDRYPSIRQAKEAGDEYRETFGYRESPDRNSDFTNFMHGIGIQVCSLDNSFRFIFNSNLYDATFADNSIEFIKRILDDPNIDDTTIKNIDILPAGERAFLLSDLNDTDCEYPDDACVHELFESAAATFPDKTAVFFEGDRVSYRELNDRANRLARYLISTGVRPDDRVAICLERSVEMVVGLLAILKAGGAYVPLDPRYPSERLAFMLEDCAPVAILTDQASRHLIAALGSASDNGLEIGQTTVPLIVLDLDMERWQGLPSENVPRASSGLTSSNLAYVIYTSGSTGRPKGALNEHRAVVNRLDWMQNSYLLGAEDVVLQKTPFSFDVSAWEFFWTLSAGSTLVVAAPEGHKDPRYLIDLIITQKVSTIHFVPSMLAIFLGAEDARLCTSLRQIICSGEALPASSARKAKQLLPGAELYNLYGPTEAAIDVTAWRCPKDFAGTIVPIGRPISNIKLYILDDYGQPVPFGAIGELYIGGVGVARGYLNRPELTAQKFLPDPFSPNPAARMYRTGDTVRYLPDRNIEYLGRNDDQVKIRGFRIELGEIEARLAEHPDVQEAAVLALKQEKPDTENQDTQIVAYVVPKVVDTTIREHLAHWRGIYDHHNQRDSSLPFGEDFGDWVSSYTLQPLPRDEMRDWRDATVSRILTLSPKNVLEIGVGRGALLSQLVPHVASYWGTDLSPRTIASLEADIQTSSLPKEKIKLLTQEASDFSSLPQNFFDTIILNSVTQYFPNSEYLLATIRSCVNAISPGGHVFIGDVRNLATLPVFACAVCLHSDRRQPADQILNSVEQRLSNEKELLVDPALFLRIRQFVQDVSDAAVHLKRGRYHNELTRHRYDVILQKAATGNEETTSGHIGEKVLYWDSDIRSIDELPRYLRGLQERVSLRNVPNSGLLPEFGAYETLRATRDVNAAVKELLGDATGQLPEQFYSLGESLGVGVQVRWSQRDGRYFDVIFLPSDVKIQGGESLVQKTSTGKFTNNPSTSAASDALKSLLQDFLGRHLPDHMMPAEFIMLDSFPLSPNGKLDRKALPTPRPKENRQREYVKPQGNTEVEMAAIWQEVLSAGPIGRSDNFFKIGGHSLLASRLLSRVERHFGTSKGISTIFSYPSLELFSRQVLLNLVKEKLQQ